MNNTTQNPPPFKFIEPATFTEPHRAVKLLGSWPNIATTLEGMLQTPEMDQRPYFFKWLKTTFLDLTKGQGTPERRAFLVGPADCAKSLIQDHVIAPLLGGRSTDHAKFDDVGSTYIDSLNSCTSLTLTLEVERFADVEPLVIGSERSRLFFCFTPKPSIPLPKERPRFAVGDPFEEAEAMKEIIAAELPAFLAFLLEYELPPLEN